jgi:hypothetical protein
MIFMTRPVMRTGPFALKHLPLSGPELPRPSSPTQNDSISEDYPEFVTTPEQERGAI